MCPHGDSAGQLAGPQNLKTSLELLDHFQLRERLYIKGVAFELIEFRQVYDCVFLTEDILEAALRKTPVQRHLSAFETAHLAVAADCLRTLVAPAGSFSATRPHTAADPPFYVLLSSRWF